MARPRDEAQLQSAQSALAAGDLAGAASICEQVVRRNPRDFNALAILGQGGPDAAPRAQKALETAYGLDAEDVDVALLLADMYIKQYKLGDAQPVLKAAAEKEKAEKAAAAEKAKK